MVLIYVLAGELHISAGGRLHDVKSGEYILLRAGEEHFGTQPSSEDISYFWVHFKCGEWRGADAEELRQTAGKGYIAAIISPILLLVGLFFCRKSGRTSRN